MRISSKIIILTLLIATIFAQPPLACPDGFVDGGFAPRPLIHALRAAIRPKSYQYVWNDESDGGSDNIWNDTYPAVLIGSELKQMHGFNGYIRKGEEIVIKMYNASIGQEIKFIPMIPACDGYYKRSLNLTLFKKNGFSWDTIQTAVNEKGVNEREIFTSSGLWVPENYSLQCLQCPNSEIVVGPPQAPIVLCSCLVEPIENIIKYNVTSAGEELKLVATLTKVGDSDKDKNGDVFILKYLTDITEHACQTQYQIDGYNQLRKALIEGKSFQDESCDDLFN